ncbi:MAG: hypothetical protein M1821_006891 [Bathelium mastoideum]|nr:MAG: hypothetical protein M1821_006891 [Bathelium mastoideum]KAI9676292.1 MAG: hypothetical protein M1822_008326 [Bathelium mastoideum]
MSQKERHQVPHDASSQSAGYQGDSTSLIHNYEDPPALARYRLRPVSQRRPTPFPYSMASHSVERPVSAISSPHHHDGPLESDIFYQTSFLPLQLSQESGIPASEASVEPTSDSDAQREYIVNRTRMVQARLQEHSLRQEEHAIPRHYQIWEKLRQEALYLANFTRFFLEYPLVYHTDPFEVGRRFMETLIEAKHADIAELEARRRGNGTWSNEDLLRSHEYINWADQFFAIYSRLFG